TPAISSAIGVPSAHESLEYMLPLGDRDAAPFVLNPDPHDFIRPVPRRPRRGPEHNRLILRPVFQSVVQQVQNDLTNALLITEGAEIFRHVSPHLVPRLSCQRLETGDDRP